MERSRLACLCEGANGFRRGGCLGRRIYFVEGACGGGSSAGGVSASLFSSTVSSPRLTFPPKVRVALIETGFTVSRPKRVAAAVTSSGIALSMRRPVEGQAKRVSQSRGALGFSSSSAGKERTAPRKRLLEEKSQTLPATPVRIIPRKRTRGSTKPPACWVSH